MNDYNIIFSERAIKDLDGIVQYITEEYNDPKTAQKVIDKVLTTIKILEAFPKRGALLENIIQRKASQRFLACGKYYAIYDISESTIEILTIIHNSRDIQALFET